MDIGFLNSSGLFHLYYVLCHLEKLFKNGLRNNTES